MFARIVVLSASAAALVAGVALPAAAQQTERPSAFIDAPRRAAKLIPNRFIVKVAPRNDPGAVASAAGARADRVYHRVFNGFVTTLSDVTRGRLLRDARVVRIEQDREAVITTTPNSWGLDRIDQHVLPLNNSYVAPATGLGVTAYVVDSGIRFDHTMFGGRAIRGIDMIGDGYNGVDCNGHGTHVAGTIGGGYGYGVAPDVTLVSVRVLNCTGSGSVSGIIGGLDWVASYGRHPAVVNMSLGGTASLSLDDAVNQLVASGIPTIVAAGNDNADACSYSPSRAASALTVAATGNDDARASFSNYGICVDLFAPGVSIASAYKTSSTAIALMSGTSMASPHVAGRAALLLEANPTMTSSALASALLTSTSTGTVINPAGSPNRIVYTGDVGTVSPPPPPPPGPVGTLTVTVTYRYSVLGQPIVSIAWSGASGSLVDVYRNGIRVTTTSNDGLWTDRPVRGTYRYKVCNANSSTCSAESSVTV